MGSAVLLHSFQFLKRQLFEEGAAGVREIMLDRIAEREKVAAGFLQTIAQRDQVLPAVGADQPVILQVA